MTRIALVVLLALIGGLLAGAAPAGASWQPGGIGEPALAWRACADRA